MVDSVDDFVDAVDGLLQGKGDSYELPCAEEEKEIKEFIEERESVLNEAITFLHEREFWDVRGRSPWQEERQVLELQLQRLKRIRWDSTRIWVE